MNSSVSVMDPLLISLSGFRGLIGRRGGMFSLREDEMDGLWEWLLGLRREEVRTGVMGTRARDFSCVWREMSFFSRGGIRCVSFSY